jgi:hypothetical protein
VKTRELEGGHQVQRAMVFRITGIRRTAALRTVGIRGQSVSHALLDHLW